MTIKSASPCISGYGSLQIFFVFEKENKEIQGLTGIGTYAPIGNVLPSLWISG